MTYLDSEILKLIRENKSMKDICEQLNITQKQLYIRIRRLIDEYKYQISSSYSYNSDIYYKLENKKVTSSNKVSIKLPNKDTTFRCIVISDTHIGNIDADINLINMVYEYAAKNNIHIIIFCGDMLEGAHTSDKKSIYSAERQIETFIKKYPYDKDIMNFGILGNHEYHFLHYDNIDVLDRINDARSDMVLLDYGDGLINLRKDYILLHHDLRNTKNDNLYNKSKIVLSGHGHVMKSKFYDRLHLCVPTLSYVSPNKKIKIIPGFIDLEIDFNKQYFDYVKSTHLVITSGIQIAGETRCMIKELIK